MHFYLDESGDLGWKFDKPYRYGGSSRFLTIAVLQVPASKVHLPIRLIKKLYTRFDWNPKQEKKWAEMTDHERLYFAQQALLLSIKNPDIRYWAMVVKKENVQAHIRTDANKIYNYMIKLLLCEEMSRHPSIRFVPDPRSIKIESGNSLHDYLQAELWFERNVSTVLTTEAKDSRQDKNVQFADMLAGAVQHYFQDNKYEVYRAFQRKITVKKLYFGR
jgi:hypothetical protein